VKKATPMTHDEAFLADIRANPDDDGVRLIYADWLEENGQPQRAEFIRVQVELEPMRDQYEIRRAMQLHERESQLLKDTTWLGEMPEGWNHWQTGMALEFRRGFPDLLRGPTRSFLPFGPAIRTLHPTIRRVVLHCFNGWGERLAACEGLQGLAELELACWYADADLEVLARSPHLAGLRVLVLWLGRQSDVGSDANLCRLAARARAWPNLRELVLLDPEGESEKEIRRLVASANRSARRKIARYERGYPKLFPLDGAFYYDFPVAGRLPDGRAAVADLDRGPNPHRDSIPAGLIVRTFDAAGVPTGEDIRVPLPKELPTIKLGDVRNWDGQYTQHLTDTIGFEPGFIRVQAGALGDFGPRRGHYDNWDQCGAADDPEGDSEWENGIGGMIYHYVRDVEFIVGYDAWADKRGQVHST
jgi:uncharacterized protein (TIGR02996 family)